MNIQTRQKAMAWWSKLNLENKFYKTIEANEVLVGDTVDNHPDRLTGSEIEKVFLYHNKSKCCTICESKEYTQVDNHFKCTKCKSFFI